MCDGAIIGRCGNRDGAAGVQWDDQIAVNRSAHQPPESDAELVRRAQLGTAAAFAELVTRYQDRVFNICYRMCHNHADALDLTQSTFLKAWEALARFERRANFYTWLFRIAANLTISHRRAAQRHATTTVGEFEAAAPATDESLEQRELRRQVEWSLARLDEEFRLAVVLKDVEELDYATIAEILAVPIGTVKSRIHRGRMMLRDLLKEACSSRD